MKNLLIIVFFLSLFSCRKLGHGYIKGVVLEQGNDAPISGATVLFEYFTQGKYERYWDSCKTDINGKFVFYFNKEFGHEYWLYVPTREYASGEVERIRLKKNNFTFRLTPFAYIKFHIKKIGSVDNSFSISSYRSTYTIPRRTTPIDTFFNEPCKVPAGRNSIITWKISNYIPSINSVDSSTQAIILARDTLFYTKIYQ